MAVISTSFRWLDYLEKEFDKAFVDLDILIADFDNDDPGMVYSVRQKLATISSCFAQLSHKAQTIFQINAKSEAELINLREELIETKSENDKLNRELHSLLVKLHTSQLERLEEDNTNTSAIKQRLESDLATISPTHRALITGGNVDNLVLSLENWKRHLLAENTALRNCIVSLQGEVCGARLAARYLDKELAGRIQQLQLLGRTDMNTECRDKLWSQLEAEILLQRHKTVQKAVRQQTANSSLPPPSSNNVIRTVTLKREALSGLGISITGGREHGVPILISELEPSITKGLYIGDAIISVNGIDLTQSTHQQAVDLLNKQVGTVNLRVQYLSNSDYDDDENESESNNELNRLRYGYFNEEDEEKIEAYVHRITSNTPTAPRTPETDQSVSENIILDEVSTEPAIESEESNQSQETAKSDYYGVTTLQKIFQSFSPKNNGKDEAANDGIKSGDPKSESIKENSQASSINSLSISPDARDDSKSKLEPIKLETDQSFSISHVSDNWVPSSSADSPNFTSSSLDCISSDSDNSTDKKSTNRLKFSSNPKSILNHSDMSKVTYDNQTSGHSTMHTKQTVGQDMQSKFKSRSQRNCCDLKDSKKNLQLTPKVHSENSLSARSSSKSESVSKSVPENTSKPSIPLRVVSMSSLAEKQEPSPKTPVEILCPDSNSNMYRIVENKNSVVNINNDKIVRCVSIESEAVCKSRRSSDMSNHGNHGEKVNLVKSNDSKDGSDVYYLYNNLNDASLGTPV